MADANTYDASYSLLPEPVTMNDPLRWGQALVDGAYKILGVESSRRTADGASSARSKPNNDGNPPDALSRLGTMLKEAIPVINTPLQNRYRALPVRSNPCLERALAGEPLPVNSQSMRDIIDYCGLLGTGLQPGYSYRQALGQESADPAMIDMVADAQHDPKVYANHCTSCHLDF
jgi:cytochrome c